MSVPTYRPRYSNLQVDSIILAATIKSSAAHLLINSGTTSSDLAGKTVRINNITNTGTADSFIGFQVKPAAGASTANDIKGGEISPRVNSAIALTGTGTIIGLHVDAYLKGTTGNIGGDVRGLNIELVTDDAGARDIGGYVTAMRVRKCFSAGTVTGIQSVFRLETPESQTGSENYDGVFEFPTANGSIWNVKGSDYTPQQPRAKIKFLVGTTPYWLIGYATEPS